MAMAVLPEEGGPAIKTARPAMRPSCTILRMTPAAFLAFPCPTIPCDADRGSRCSSRPRPRMCEWAPIRSMRVTSPAQTVKSLLRGGSDTHGQTSALLW
jgi:hypothetical protein